MKKALIQSLLILMGIMIFASFSWALCHPQCGEYARDKSGIRTCGGTNGIDSTVLDWYRCGNKSGRTTDTPKAGRVIILPVSKAGHAIYIDKSENEGSGKYSLKISHSNFDNNCGIETKKKATYYKSSKKLKIKEGVWDKTIRLVRPPGLAAAVSDVYPPDRFWFFDYISKFIEGVTTEPGFINPFLFPLLTRKTTGELPFLSIRETTSFVATQSR
jgi:hypothetical protein